MKNLKRAVDGTGNTMAAGKINDLRTLLRGESLREFDKPASHNAGTKYPHLKFIQEGLISHFSKYRPFQEKAHNAMRNA